MPEPYPNQFLSIPQSIVSLKHYFRVHDQPFSRSLIYLALVALAIALFAAGMAFFGYRHGATQHAKLLTEKLAGVRFEEGQASSDATQPAVLYRDPVLLVVLDTTGKADTLEQALDLAGCARPARFCFFGTSAVESVELATKADQKPKQETCKYTEAAKLAELRKLIEDAGGKMAAIQIFDEAHLPRMLANATITQIGHHFFRLGVGAGAWGTALFDGSARFAPGRIAQSHSGDGEFPVPSSPDLVIPLQNARLMVIVDTTGRDRKLAQAIQETANANPAWAQRLDERWPQFLVLLSAKGAQVKASGRATPVAWDFSKETTPASVAKGIAVAIRDVRMNFIFPMAVETLVMGALLLFVFALMLSVAGMLANALLRANLAYVELLTLAVYAVTPAVVGFLLVASVLQGRGGQWPLVMLFGLGMAYTAMGVHRTARELALIGAPPL